MIMPSLMFRFAHDVCQIVQMKYRDVLDCLADNRWIDIECGDDLKVLCAKAFVAQERMPQITRPDHSNIPGMVGAENLADRLDQLRAFVAYAGVAKMTEVGEVLADLGISKAKQRTELVRTCRLVAGADQMLQFAQVKAQPTDDGFGNWSLGCFLRAFGHGKPKFAWNSCNPAVFAAGTAPVC